MSHTPTPWADAQFGTSESGDVGAMLCVPGASLKILLGYDEGFIAEFANHEDAAFARRACNSLPSSVEAMEAALDFLGSVDGAAEVRGVLLAALSKAEGDR